MQSKGLGRIPKKKRKSDSDAPDFLLATQWAAALRVAVPEKLLLIALLGMAVVRARKPHNEKTCLRCQEWEWMFDEKKTMGEGDRHFPFRVVCDYLGLNPAWVIRKTLEKASRPWAHPKWMKADNWFLVREKPCASRSQEGRWGR